MPYQGTISRICEQCGITFYVYPCRAQAQWCSTRCRGLWRRSPHQAPPILKQCKVCNADFRVYPYRAEAEFCSTACAGASKRGQKKPPRSATYRANISRAKQGNRNPQWHGGVSETTHERVTRELWRAWRRRYLSTHAQCCELCGVPARVLHHRIPVRLWSDGEFVESNIQVLCRSCHAQVEDAIRKLER